MQKNKRLYFFLIICLFCLRVTAQDTLLNAVGIKYDITLSDKATLKPWHLLSTEYIRKINKSSIIARLNYAHRFGLSDAQAEVDAYPVLSRKVYAYLNAGVAPGKKLFPSFRTGLSLFFVLPAKFETEGGIRYLNFNAPIYIYTASVGKYYKKYWFNLSTFLSPVNSNISSSFFLKSRYYFNDTDFAMLLLGTGLSPDNTVDNTLLNTFLKSKKVELSLRKHVSKQLIFLMNMGLSKQQISQASSINQYNFGVGLQQQF